MEGLLFVLVCLIANNNLRHVGSTLANATSSRSHAVFTLYITNNFTDGGQRKVRSSRLHLIDLAGSESQKLTQTAGAQLQEASSINKVPNHFFRLIHIDSHQALLNLGKVIRDIVAGDKHVSYRDSKLTLLLKVSAIPFLRSKSFRIPLEETVRPLLLPQSLLNPNSLLKQD